MMMLKKMTLSKRCILQLN